MTDNPAAPSRKSRSAATVLLWPSVGVLLAWSIGPLLMTLYFSARRYNLLDSTVTGWAGSVK